MLLLWNCEKFCFAQKKLRIKWRSEEDKNRWCFKGTCFQVYQGFGQALYGTMAWFTLMPILDYDLAGPSKMLLTFKVVKMTWKQSSFYFYNESKFLIHLVHWMVRVMIKEASDFARPCDSLYLITEANRKDGIKNHFLQNL